ncbi:MAG: F-box protein [Chlamydiales bacterium]|nr:F-box protein [Chlamydiales bacterium]
MHSVNTNWSPFPSDKETVEEIKDRDLFSQQPLDIIIKIFTYLSVVELAKCGEISRKFRRLASDSCLWNAFDLKRISPLLKVFDESDWVTHFDISSFGLDVTDAPSLDKRKTIPNLKRHLSSLPIEGDAGITLLTIPKGLTLKKLLELARSTSKMEERTQFRNISDHIIREIGDISIDKTYRIIITNNILKKSRNLSIDEHIALVIKIGCEMPKVLEASVLLVVTFMISGESLYSNIPVTYTRCSEQISDYQLAVGGFMRDGVFVTRCASNYETLGVAAVLHKF